MDYQCVVVGAGPAGIACAATLAQKGVRTLLLERGDRVGEKNVASTVLQTDILEEIIPGFRDSFPREREISGVWVTEFKEKTHFNFVSHFEPKGKEANLFTIFRSDFDYWFARQAEKAGADVVCGARVDRLILEDGKVKGVISGEEEIRADIVILADGILSLLAERAGLIPPLDIGKMELGCKEVLALPEEVINQRFGLAVGQGIIMHMEYGYPLSEVKGSVTMYVNRESISLAVFAPCDELARAGFSLPEALEKVKAHPFMERLLEGAKVLEYQAHQTTSLKASRLRPEQTFGDGYLLCGDAGSFRNGMGIGITSAMLSGKLAAEAAAEAVGAGDVSKKHLSSFLTRIKNESYLYELERKIRKGESGMEKLAERTPGYVEMISTMSEHLLFDSFVCRKKPDYSYGKDLYRYAIREYIPRLIRAPFDLVAGYNRRDARRKG